MRRIVYYVATSADGFIARPNGDVSWLDRPMPRGAYGMAAFFRTIGTAVMGRKTWDFGRRHGKGEFPGMRAFVFTRRRNRKREPGVEFVHGGVRALGRRLRAERGGKHVWLVGGAELAAAFLDAGEIDEAIVHVIPIVLGDGIPLFAPRRRDVSLRLRASRRFADGVVRLHYAVERAR